MIMSNMNNFPYYKIILQTWRKLCPFFKCNWPLFMLFVAVFAGAFQAGHSFVEGDTFWHIRNGQWILENHQVPLNDPFSWSAGGRPWVAHEWLWDLLAWLAWHTCGRFGLWLLMLAGIIVFTLSLWVVLRRQASSLMAAILVGMVLIIVPPFWCARPHVMATAWLALCLALLIAGQERPWLLFCMVPLGALWANMHSSVMFLLLFSVIALISALVERASERYVKYLLMATAVSALAICLNPHGSGLYRFVAQAASNSLMLDNIAEWQSPDFHASYMYPFLVMIVIDFCLLLRKRPVPVFHGFIAVVTLIISLMQVRQAPLFYFSSAILMADLLPWEPELTPGYLYPLSIILVVGLCITAWPLQISWEEWPRDCEAYPAGAVSYMQEHHYTNRVFNDYRWGGYLIFHNIKPFIDGRADLYIFSGTHVFQDYLAVKYGNGEDPIKILKRNRVKTVLIPPYALLRWQLEQSNDWSRVYADRYSLVYVLND